MVWNRFLSISLFFLFVNIYSEDLSTFSKIRNDYQTKVPYRFKANFTQKSAQQMVKDKIPGDYSVSIDYSMDKGVRIFVNAVDPFYRDYLSSLAITINKILVPFLANSAYRRFKDHLSFSEIDINTYKINLTQGAFSSFYYFGLQNGLLKYITYFEGKKKVYNVFFEWVIISSQSFPEKIKIINYEKTKSSMLLELTDFEVLDGKE